MAITRIIGLFLCLTILSCKKEKRLPEEYIACKVNGQDWSVSSDDNLFSEKSFSADWSEGGKLLIIQGVTAGTSLGIALHDTLNELQSQKYTLDGGARTAMYRDYNKYARYDYKTDAEHTGIAHVQFDETAMFVTGTFSFVAKLEISNEIITVTEGRFRKRCQKH